MKWLLNTQWTKSWSQFLLVLNSYNLKDHVCDIKEITEMLNETTWHTEINLFISKKLTFL